MTHPVDTPPVDTLTTDDLADSSAEHGAGPVGRPAVRLTTPGFSVCPIGKALREWSCAVKALPVDHWGVAGATKSDLRRAVAILANRSRSAQVTPRQLALVQAIQEKAPPPKRMIQTPDGVKPWAEGVELLFKDLYDRFGISQ